MSVKIKDEFQAPTEKLEKFKEIQESNALIKREQEAPKISNSLVKIKKERQLQKPEWHPPWKLFRVISGHLGWVRSVSVDVGNEWFATGAGDRMIKIWDLATGTLKLSLTGHINTVRGLAISPRHPYLFSAGEDKMVKCWDLETNKVIRHYHGHLSGVFCLDIHPTLDIIVTGGRDSCARVWDIRTKSQIFALTGHQSTVASVKTQEGDPQIITSSNDSTIKLWDLAAGKCRTTLTHHKKSVRALAIHPREFTFASGSPDNIKTWTCPDGNFIQNASGHNAIINTLSINQDGVMVSGGDNGSIKFWDFKTATCFQSLDTIVQPGSMESEAGIFCSTFDKTGTRLITGEADKTIKIWKQDETATEETHPEHLSAQMYKKPRVEDYDSHFEQLKLDKLESDRQYLFSKVENLQEIIEQERKTQISLKEEHAHKVSDFLKEKNQLMNSMTDLQLKFKNSSQEKDLKIQELQAKTDAFQNYISDLERKIQENLQSCKSKNEIMDFEMQKEILNLQNLTKKEENVLLKQLSQNLNHVAKLEKEISNLKKEIDHYKTLDLNLFKKQEEISSLNNQIAQLSSLRGELAAVQAEKGLLLQEKARWSKFCEEEDGIVDPVTLTRSLAQCRLESAQLKQELGEARTEKAGRQGYITRLEQDLQDLTQKLQDLETSNQNLQKQLKIQERGKKLAHRETEFLRTQLESFDLEQDLVGNGFDDKKVKRIKELEALLDNYKEEMNSLVLNTEIKAEQVVHTEDIHSTLVSQKISDLKNENSELKVEKGMLEKQTSSFEAQLHELQRALGRGEADFSEQRVLMLKENPSSQADQARYEELLALRSENEALRSSISTIPTESVKVLEMKISELQQDLFTKEKRMIRLKEVLNAQVQEFRASICSILGFKVDMQPQGKLKLSSIYSTKWTMEFDTHGNFLGFSGASSTDRLQDGVSKYLERSHIPAFMAWLTLHLFESSD